MSHRDTSDHRRPCAAGALAARAAALAVAVLAAGCYAPAKPRAPVTRPAAASASSAASTRPAIISAFGANLPWRVPPSRAAGRMQGPAPGDGRWPGSPVYVALWDAGGRAGAGPLLVALQQNPADLFGAIWNVQLLDRNGRVLRRGQTRCDEFEYPYCLMEVKSDSPLIPAGYRGRWVLAVAFLDDDAAREEQRRVDEADRGGAPIDWTEPEEPAEDAGEAPADGEDEEQQEDKPPAFDPSKPLYVDSPASDESLEGNVVTVDPVRWAEDDDDFTGGVGVLRFEESLPVAYRHAEAAMAGAEVVDPEAAAAAE